MDRRTLFLKKLTTQLFRNGSRELTGRSRGIRTRETLERILGESEEVVWVLDFTGTGSIDFSWADEVVAKMVSRLWSNEYGETFLVLRGLSPSQTENIGVALERKRLAVLTIGPSGWQVVGSLNNYLVHTLQRVMKKRQLTLRELSEEEGIGMNTSGTRLLNLYKKRLVSRVEGNPRASRETSHRGRQYIYESLLPLG